MAKIRPDDLSLVIDSICRSTEWLRAWNVKGFYFSVDEYKSMPSVGLICVPIPNYISAGVDPERIGVAGSGIFERRELPVLIDESVTSKTCVDPHSNDRACVVNCIQLSSNCLGRRNRRGLREKRADRESHCRFLQFFLVRLGRKRVLSLPPNSEMGGNRKPIALLPRRMKEGKGLRSDVLFAFVLPAKA